MCSVEVFHGDDGCTSSDLDGGDKLGENQRILKQIVGYCQQDKVVGK